MTTSLSLKTENLPSKVISPELLERDKYISLYQSQKVAQIAFNELAENAKSIIISAFFNSGAKPLSPQEMEMLIRSFIQDCQEFFPNVGIFEIKEAVKMGSKGLFGDVYGINPKAWCNWIKTYLADENRKKAIMQHQQKQIAVPESEKLGKDEAIEIIKKSVAECREIFKQNGIVYDAKGVIYNYLVFAGEIKFEFDLHKFKEQAKENILKANSLSRRALKKPSDLEITLEAQRLSLKEYFKN